MKNTNNYNNIPDSMIKEVSSSTGINSEELKKNLAEGKMDNILSKINGKDSEKIKKILSDREMTEKILNSPQAVALMKKLKGKIKKSSVDNMFKGSGIYTEAENNIVHTILVDEAHRLNAKSGMFQNMGENQIKEIIHAAMCSVFLSMKVSV